MRVLQTSLAIALFAAAGYADGLYNAGLGSLPQAQGFLYGGDNGNQSPFVSNGLLVENTTVGNQYWSKVDSQVDFSESLTLQLSILINSSNYVPRIGDGSSREGYYVELNDKIGQTYTVGLASSGFIINDYQGKSLHPYSIAGQFHAYTLSIANNEASFSIDGAVVESGIAPQPFNVVQLPSQEFFGGLAGLSVSDTRLSYVCYSTDSSPCAPSPSAVPEPSSVFYAFGGMAALALITFRRSSEHLK